jgi:hypothetical protein
VTVLFADGRQEVIARAPKPVIADKLWSLLTPMLQPTEETPARAFEQHA